MSVWHCSDVHMGDWNPGSRSEQYNDWVLCWTVCHGSKSPYHKSYILLLKITVLESNYLGVSWLVYISDSVLGWFLYKTDPHVQCMYGN